MFARILEFIPTPEKKEELVKVIKNQVLPIVKKQPGFLEVLPFFPEINNEKAFVISLWSEKKFAQVYEREWYPKVEEIIRPYLSTPVTYKYYQLETTVCQNFERALTA